MCYLGKSKKIPKIENFSRLKINMDPKLQKQINKPRLGFRQDSKPQT